MAEKNIRSPKIHRIAEPVEESYASKRSNSKRYEYSYYFKPDGSTNKMKVMTNGHSVKHSTVKGYQHVPSTPNLNVSDIQTDKTIEDDEFLMRR